MWLPKPQTLTILSFIERIGWCSHVTGFFQGSSWFPGPLIVAETIQMRPMKLSDKDFTTKEDVALSVDGQRDHCANLHFK